MRRLNGKTVHYDHTGSLDTSSQETRRSRTDCVSAAPSHRSRCLSFRRQPVPVSSDTLLRIHRLCCLHIAYHLGRHQACLICFALHPLYKITICIISHIFLVLDLVFHKMPTYLRHCLTSGADLISIQKGTSL